MQPGGGLSQTMRFESVPRASSHLERRTMALALTALYIAGGFLTLVSILLPHPDQVNERGALFNAAVALLAGACLFRWGHLLPLPGFHVLIGLGSALIALGIHFGGYVFGSPSYGLFFLWVIVYAFSFLTLTQAMLQAGFAAALHLGVLVIDVQLYSLVTDWTITWGILTVTGLVVGWLSGQVRTLAETDQLTGLRNRRAWDNELSRELANAARTDSAVSLILVDVDGLKRLNDTQGHQAGDRLLKEAAAAWSGSLRSGDLIARLGGDEFGILLSSCTLEGAHRSLTRLQEATRATFSAGCASWDRQESPDEFMHRADLVLYENKRARGIDQRAQETNSA